MEPDPEEAGFPHAVKDSFYRSVASEFQNAQVIILENDDHHSFEFVMEVLQKALGCNAQRAFLFTEQAHTTGRAVVWTGTKEVAELKYDQIRTFEEIRADGSKLGPLGCSIEPAPG